VKTRRVITWTPDPADPRWRIYRLECGHFVRRWGRNERRRARCETGRCNNGAVITDQQLRALGRLGSTAQGRDLIRNHGSAIASIMVSA
jgi:hypothetical protein